MKKGKSLLGLTLAFFLVFSFAGSVLADEHVTTNVTEDGRIQVILEFDDAEEAQWALEYIGKMKAKNVIAGYPDGTFQPNKPVKRVEAIVMAVRLMGLEEEAKAKSPEIQLHFKDAKQINNQYAWAKGYIAVALENGLFDASEDKIQPDKPASRIWVSSLLVRALGLQQEALEQMTEVPDFKDAHEIPAGAIGYVNVAVEQGIVSGYPDETFKPNKSVTRAEMAALLDRTDDGLLENEGALLVSGKVTAISFDEDSVTGDVYGATDGSVTVETFNGESFTYLISSDLLVQYHERFVRADQLKVDDVVTLVVKDGAVVEAALTADEAVEEAVLGIIEMKIEAEYGDKEEFKLEYKIKNGKAHGEIKIESKEHDQEMKVEETGASVAEFVEQLALSPEMSQEEIVTVVLAALELEDGSFEKLEIKIKFSNGEKVKIEIEEAEAEQAEELEGENEDAALAEEYLGIREFKLEYETKDEQKVKVKYESENGRVKAEFEYNTDDGEHKVKGEEAVDTIQFLLDQLALTSDMDEEEVLEKILFALELDKDQLKELKADVQFADDEKIKVEFENEDDDEDDEENEHED